MPRQLLALCAGATTVLLAAAPIRISAQQAEHARVEHVVLISVDGLRPEFYLDERWPAPTLQQMAREGAHARAVRSVAPSVTYPSHTTMITGARPARHGIVYNTPFEGPQPSGRWYWEADAIRTPTLWDAVRAAGGTSAAVSWPVTVGAPIDYNVPEIFSLERGGDPLRPMRDAATPRGLVEELEREAVGRLTWPLFGGAENLGRDDRSGLMAAYLLEKHRPTLLALHIYGTDHFQHVEGRDGPMVRRALAALDRAVAQVVEAADRAGIRERTAFIVTGDHGFVDVTTRVSPNVWLARAGLAPADSGAGPWRALFHPSAGSAFLHLRDPADTASLAQVRSVLATLPAAQRRLFRVVDRAELDSLGAAPAAQLALAAIPGVIFGGQRGGDPVTGASGGTHGYFPDFPDIHTGFIGWGAGFRPGAVVTQMHLAEVAPTVAELLGLRFETPDGMLHPGLLRARTP